MLLLLTLTLALAIDPGALEALQKRAAELDTDAVELDELEAELEGPEITSETDDDPEW